MGSIADKLNYLLETKRLIKQVIIEKGVEVSDSDSFRSYIDKISEERKAEIKEYVINKLNISKERV